jgi:hypothetical protein
MGVNKAALVAELKERKHFAQIPNELGRAVISVNARLVWMYLTSEGPRWNSSIENVARNTGLHRNSVSHAIKELVEVSMLTKASTNTGTSFTLLPPSEWRVQFHSSPTHIAGAPAAHDMGELPHTESASAAHREEGIQEYNNTNTAKTRERKRSREVEKSIDDYFLKEANDLLASLETSNRF